MSLSFNERRRDRLKVQPGDLFRRSRGFRQTETATVLDLKQDLFGIPHVRFSLAFEAQEIGRFEMGSRTLALRSFIQTYPERVS